MAVYCYSCTHDPDVCVPAHSRSKQEGQCTHAHTPVEMPSLDIELCRVATLSDRQSEFDVNFKIRYNLKVWCVHIVYVVR